MVRLGLQQALQLLARFAAVAVFFFYQRQQQPVIEVGIAPAGRSGNSAARAAVL
jgi:hypothetical protein